MRHSRAEQLLHYTPLSSFRAYLAPREVYAAHSLQHSSHAQRGRRRAEHTHSWDVTERLAHQHGRLPAQER